ncbi:MAG: FAD-binding oxidoreductase [Taibaiella sp.]|nr:FAD-binding oxidoreductase [Taibaiella sp.]
MFSYWEQECFTHYDHIIVGAGIVGLSLAIELAGKYPESRILVAERGLLSSGASTRNAGFACMGSATELLDDLSTTNEDEVVALFAARKAGLEKLRNRLGDARIGYKADGGYELISDKEYGFLDKLEYLNRILLPVVDRPAFGVATELVPQFGFGGAYAKALIENTCEGGIDTGKMMRALIDMVLQCGVEIKTGAAVAGYAEEAGRVEVRISDPFRQQDWQLSCSTLSICTNAFTKKLIPDADVIPGRGQVLITDPVPGLKFRGVFHFDTGYYYFRELDGRVLFGGGRNMDFETEQTEEIGLNELIQADLEEKLATIILPGQSFSIAHRWSGIMAFGKTKQPIVQAISDRVFGAFRMGGMGVALGSEVAGQLAAIIAGQNDKWQIG